MTIEGVPEEAIPEARGDGTGSPPPELAAGLCGSFENEMNLVDLVEDVQDIIRTFTDHLASQSATPLQKQSLPVS